MGFVLLGHGILRLTPGTTPPGHEIVAVPPGTTLQFYSDACQRIAYCSEDLDAWDRLESPWPPLRSGEVTYNFTLTSAWDDWEEELQNDPRFGGHMLVRPGIGDYPDPFLLCTGAPGPCPTDPRQAAAGARHHCDGVLGRNDLAGELHWVACTAASAMPPALKDAVIDGLAETVVLGDHPYWTPGEKEQRGIAAVNRRNVQAARDGQALRYVVAGRVFLVAGAHPHDDRLQEHVLLQADAVQGRVLYKRSGVMSPGGFHVMGLPSDRRGVVRAAIARFSDKRIHFS
ncbi:hypothetical protein ACFQ78_32015 [Streptomyces sp. NPDC056519]|uniref:hypothetical protein n=1 Tax=Streptomyces sp. NPDC056519 TaxID=3345849 RepID=UPI0036D0C010